MYESFDVKNERVDFAAIGGPLNPGKSDKQVAALAAQFDLDGGLACDQRRCLVELTAAEAQKWSAAATLPRGGPAVCTEVNAEPDAKGSYGAYGDPCCDWGGSSCTRSFGWAVSTRARKPCVSR